MWFYFVHAYVLTQLLHVGVKGDTSDGVSVPFEMALQSGILLEEREESYFPPGMMFLMFACA